MRHQIDLQIAGLGDIPLLRLDRNLLLEQRARSRRAIQRALEPRLTRLQTPFQLSGANRQQLSLLHRRQGDALA